METAIFVVIVVTMLAVWLLPVYVLILASFRVKSRDWREVKWLLRAASLVSLALGLAAWHAHHPLLGEFMAPDSHAIVHTLVWTWAGGLGCALAALFVDACLRLIRQSRSKAGSGEA